MLYNHALVFTTLTLYNTKHRQCTHSLWPTLHQCQKLINKYPVQSLVTSVMSCLLSTTSSGTLSSIDRNLSTASWNFPCVVSWYATCRRWTRSFSLSPMAGTPPLAPASFLQMCNLHKFKYWLTNSIFSCITDITVNASTDTNVICGWSQVKCGPSPKVTIER